ncbi:TauD/TfdA family dioxygenase [Streptomyces sp. H27-D2]|uniref:TauD/TfdA family dioxygenase n=1 Tax=Streptomyces sp. H27-D2 TaxID=3046304 RepID=UPI002DB7A4D4|nr:TauD/TfdA family dioxygenase [Streptomyces sp. H27-D2]MEC4020485.1 TauD/TfdA family dioxygenase [Streptomyces sp. H27-D2]
MREAIAQPVELFMAHHVDHTSARAEGLIAAQLRDDGIVTVDGLFTRSAVLAFASRIMAVRSHRDSDPDGLTSIRDTHRHDRRIGFAGLGNGELAPHTERAGVPVPPRLMLMVCEQTADRGGECLLTDGRAAHADLSVWSPEAAVMLAKPRTAYFGTGDGHPSQVFTVHRGGRVSVRLRQDDLARWSPLVARHVPDLRDAIIRNQHKLSLAVGQAYLVDNERWLHARTRFSGDRRFLRALGEPRFAVPDGFAVDPAAAALPLTLEVA